MLTELESSLLNQWRQVCDENHSISQEYLDLSFLDSLNPWKMSSLDKRREIAHQKWLVLFKLLADHQVFEKNKTYNELDLLPPRG